MSVVESITKHEGFSSVPYPDPIHGWKRPTFGHGLTYITEDESRAIVEKRVEELDKALSPYYWYYSQPQEVKDVIIEMAYQMGLGGVHRFKNTIAALEQHNYEEAAKEMLDSKWAKQTPERANELADRIRAFA